MSILALIMPFSFIFHQKTATHLFMPLLPANKNRLGASFVSVICEYEIKNIMYIGASLKRSDNYWPEPESVTVP